MIDIRVTKARSTLVMDHPFFGSLIMRMRMAASLMLPDKSMATDGTSIWYHPEFLDEVSAAELLGVLVHELFHCILGHHVRRGDRDPRLWNMACDYVVNLMVINAGFVLPKWGLLDRQYAGLNAEQVYRLLKDEDEKQQQQQQPQDQGNEDQTAGAGDSEASEDDGEGVSDDADDASDDGGSDDMADEDGGDSDDQGNGDDNHPDQNHGQDDDADDDQESDDADGSADDAESGDDSSKGTGNATHGDVDPNSQGDPGRCGEILDAAPAHDKAALSEAEGEWEIAVRQASNVAKKQGNQPGFLQEIIDHLNDPRVDWHDVLNRFIDPSTSRDYSWMNPNRRMLSIGHYAPGWISDGVSHVGMVVDSSASVSSEILERVGAEVQGALDTGRIDKLTVIFCDTRVTKHDEYSTGDLIDWTIPGRGGTAFSPAFEWLNENAPDLQCAIYLTDMDCTDYGVAPVYPVLWAGYGDPRQLKEYMARAPFGECLDVNQ